MKSIGTPLVRCENVSDGQFENVAQLTETARSKVKIIVYLQYYLSVFLLQLQLILLRRETLFFRGWQAPSKIKIKR